MTLMSGLQDKCGRFAEHVFAISAVSGGAIGAAVFRGLASQPGPVQECDAPPEHKISHAVEGIGSDDHLSPLLLATPIDWATKLPAVAYRLLSWIFTNIGLAALLDHGSKSIPAIESGLADLDEVQTRKRAETLRQSFLKSYSSRSPTRKPAGLDDALSSYWRQNSPALHLPPCNGRLERCSPALVLAATSVETGHRVAFAPFSLIGVGDGTLHAFSDLARQLKLTAQSSKDYAGFDVIRAAVTSARFPGVLPAWPIEHLGSVTSKDTEEKRRLNFVDGGYSDASGATIAVDILEKLRIYTKESDLSKHVQFRLILLTDSETSLDIPRIKGTSLPDVVAPVSALLSSRQLLATTAILRAKSQIETALGTKRS